MHREHTKSLTTCISVISAVSFRRTLNKLKKVYIVFGNVSISDPIISLIFFFAIATDHFPTSFTQMREFKIQFETYTHTEQLALDSRQNYFFYIFFFVQIAIYYYIISQQQRRVSLMFFFLYLLFLFPSSSTVSEESLV